jgi:hypothetical protein
MKTQIERKFGTLKVTLFSIVVISLFAATPTSFASTSHVVYASGSFTFANTVVSENIGAHRTTVYFQASDVFIGALNGTLAGIGVVYVYPNDLCTFTLQAVFTGTIGSSKTGTALWLPTGIQTGTCIVGGSFEGTIHFSEGTGGLAGLQGSLGVEGSFPTTLTSGIGTYAGILHLS